MRVLSQQELNCVGGGANEAATATAAVTLTVGCITTTAAAIFSGNLGAATQAGTACTSAVATWGLILQGADPAVPTTPNLPPAPQLDFSPNFGSNDYDHSNCGSNCKCMG